MLCLSGFELYSRWLSLKIKCIKVICMNITDNIILVQTSPVLKVEIILAVE